MNDHLKRSRLPAMDNVLRIAVRVAAIVASGLMPVCSTLRGADAADTRPAGDLDVKAAFVLNFIRLVNWSNGPGEQDKRELPVCAFSRSDFFATFQDASAGKTVGTRLIACKIEPVPDAGRCRVLLVDRAHYQSAGRVLGTIKGAPILTVGNGPGFLDAGGMFELNVDQGKVQFDVGLEAIRRSGLDVSGRLLHLSRNLRMSGNGVY